MTDYRQKGLAGGLAFGRRPAVLVIDFVNGFTDPRSALGSELDDELVATAALLEEARTRGLTIVFTTTVYRSDLQDAGVFIEKVPALALLVAGSDAVEVDRRLGMRDDEVLVTKQYASAFFGTSLTSTLTARGVDTLLIAGCTTSGCVRASVVDALQCGFRPFVVEDCVGDRSRDAHRANLLDIQGKYGEVISIDRAVSLIAETV